MHVQVKIAQADGCQGACGFDRHRLTTVNCVMKVLIEGYWAIAMLGTVLVVRGGDAPRLFVSTHPRIALLPSTRTPTYDYT